MGTLIPSGISSSSGAVKYGSVLMSWKKLFISLGSIKDVTGILLSFLPVILFIVDHQSFVPDLYFRFSFQQR